MKPYLIYLASALILMVVVALATGITYGAQALFFTLILLFLALLVRVMVTAFEGRR
jgi:hypothetical protein